MNAARTPQTWRSFFGAMAPARKPEEAPETQETKATQTQVMELGEYADIVVAQAEAEQDFSVAYNKETEAKRVYLALRNDELASPGIIEEAKQSFARARLATDIACNASIAADNAIWQAEREFIQPAG